MAWSVTSSETWVTISPSSGSLEPGESVVVTISFNGEAEALPPAEDPYVAQLTFSNGTNGCGNTTLQAIVNNPIGPPPS